MDQADLTRIRHMLDAAREAMGFAQGKSREHLEHDRMLALALLKDLEIIGEAANRVSPEARSQCPGVPWADIVGMRNWPMQIGEMFGCGTAHRDVHGAAGGREFEHT